MVKGGKEQETQQKKSLLNRRILKLFTKIPFRMAFAAAHLEFRVHGNTYFRIILHLLSICFWVKCSIFVKQQASKQRIAPR
jgi:hypothetical protein